MGIGVVLCVVLAILLLLVFIALWARKWLAGLFGSEPSTAQGGGVKVVRV